MKGTLLCAFLICGLLCLFPVSAMAIEEEAIWEEQSELFAVDEVEKIGKEYVDEVEIDQKLDMNAALKTILEKEKISAQGVVKSAVKSCLLLLTIVILFGLVEGMGQGTGYRFPAAPLAAALAITAVAVSDMSSLVGMGREAIEQMQTFSKVLLPSVAAATTAAGAPGAANAKQLATLLFSDMLITAINK